MINGAESFWLHEERPSQPERPSLPSGVHEADVVIVGAGLSGLWTAYWLLAAEPSLRVVVLEARRVGHGASGRNGGWVSPKPLGLAKHFLNAPNGSRESLRSLQELLRASVPQILDVFGSAGHDIDAAHDGFLSVAHTPSEAARLRKQTERDVAAGTSPGLRYLEGREARDYLNVEGVVAAAFNPHAAVVNPAKMVYALAKIVESMGAVIHEGSAVTSIGTRLVSTADAEISCRYSVNATEGYGQGIGGTRRWLAPIMSSMLVTEPLPDSYWTSVGWTKRWGVSGSGHRYFYSQRTPDNRIAFGGRGLPYKYGSRLDVDGRVSGWTVNKLDELLRTALGVDRSVAVTHAWCGMLGVPRDWTPSVSLCEETGKGLLGGYVGQGLPASYVAAGTMADLILGKKTDRTALPWVDRRRRQWEPEPLRFAGAYGVYGLYQVADVLEHKTGSPRTSIFARIADKVGGRV